MDRRRKRSLATSLFVLIFLPQLIETSELSPDLSFLPCPANDNVCILAATQYFLSTKYRGDPTVNLQQFDELNSGNIVWRHQPNSLVNIDFEFPQYIFTGLKDGTAEQVSGFGPTPEGSHVVNISMPSAKAYGLYKARGTLFQYPVDGEGHFSITVPEDNMTSGPRVNLTLRFDGQSIYKNRMIYFGVTNCRMHFLANSVVFNFQNLYKGDLVYSQFLNNIFIHNSAYVLGEIAPEIIASFQHIFCNIISNVFLSQPYSAFVKSVPSVTLPICKRPKLVEKLFGPKKLYWWQGNTECLLFFNHYPSPIFIG